MTMTIHDETAAAEERTMSRSTQNTQNTQADSKDQAEHLTNRPLPPTGAAPTIVPGGGGTGPASQAGVDTTQESLRELPPKSPRRQFGEAVDIQPDGDPVEGAKEWVRHSPGMEQSFPDAAASERKDAAPDR